MDIYDVFCKKIGYRKLSKREKILFSILILLVIEFLFYNFLLKDQVQSTSEANLKENLSPIEEEFTYKGFDDFSQDKLEKISSESNISKDSFSKDSQSDIESLIISGRVRSLDLNTIEGLTNYYGYSNIDILRSDEGNFTYRFKAEKPSKAIYYNDLKKAYFGENNLKEEVKPEEEKKVASEEPKAEKITNTKKNIKIENKKQTKASKKTSSKGKAQIKGQEDKINNLNKNNFAKSPSNISNEKKSESIYDFAFNKEDDGLKFVESEGIKLDYYPEDKVTSVYVSKNDLKDLVKLGVDRHCNGVSLSIYLPNKSFKEMGTINIAGNYLPYRGEILENNWTRIDLYQDDMSYIYFTPEDNKDLLIFIKEVDYYEEERSLYPNWACNLHRNNFTSLKHWWA